MNIMTFVLEALIKWLPIFTNYLIFIFAFVVVISIIKLVRYLFNV